MFLFYYFPFISILRLFIIPSSVSFSNCFLSEKRISILKVYFFPVICHSNPVFSTLSSIGMPIIHLQPLG